MITAADINRKLDRLEDFTDAERASVRIDDWTLTEADMQALESMPEVLARIIETTPPGIPRQLKFKGAAFLILKWLKCDKAQSMGFEFR